MKIGCLLAMFGMSAMTPIAAAQTAPITAPQTPPGDAPAASSVDEIVVTAQKREQTLSSVPISISVVTPKLLQNTDTKNLTELEGVIPSVTFEGDKTYGGSSIAIRGTVGTATPLQDDPTAIYVDGVYVSPNQFGVGPLSDLADIEIVRGPQGTLQGRNATAGALLVRTADPKPVFGGFASVSAADPDEYRAQLAVTGPVAKDLTARLSADYFNDLGWATNDRDDKGLGGERAIDLRTVFKWTPGAFSARLMLDYQKTKSEEALGQLANLTIAPTGQAVVTPTPDAVLPKAALDRLEDGHFDQDMSPHSTIESPMGALQMSYDFGPLQIISITGANNFSTQGQTDSDGLNLAPRGGYNRATIRGSNVSEELRLQSPDAGRFRWILGGYVSESSGSMLFNIYNRQYTSPTSLVSIFDAHQTNPTGAVFGDGTFYITPKLSIIGGVRYTDESKTFHNLFTVQSLITGAPLLGPLPFNKTTATFDDTSYRMKLVYAFQPNSIVYLSYSKGFKSGGFNAFSVGPTPSYNPETLKSLEGGAKAELWDRRVSLSLAAYDNNYENLQVSSGVPTGGVIITNAATAKIYGVEAEGSARLGAFRFDGNASYIDAHYDRFQNAPDVFGVLQDASGNRLLQTPEWQYFVQGTYSFQPVSGWSGEAQLNWRWRDKIYFTATNQNESNFNSPHDGEFGGQVTLRRDGTGLSVTVFGANLTQERVVNNLGLAFNEPLVSFNKPRTVGVRVDKTF